MNSTFTVDSLFECEINNMQYLRYKYDPTWRHTALGCYVLQLLQDMLHFNITYTREDSLNDGDEVLSNNNSVDFYMRPMTLKEEYLEFAYPLQAVFQWRFGFLLRYREMRYVQRFYTLPFSSIVWGCTLLTLFSSTFIFYLLSYWEKRLIGGDCCLHHEFLLAFSAYCQHILPLQANLSSRRIAYLIFIFSAYVTHCFYTSNLLSHLVSDKNSEMDLQDLANSDYEFVIIKDMNLITEKRIQEVSKDKYLRIVEEKLFKSKIMDVPSAVVAMRDTKTAVLTDYTTLYPIVRKLFEINALCELKEVKLYPNVKKYMLSSKTFTSKEQFKVGILRLKEAGLISRIIDGDHLIISCKDITHNIEKIDLSLIYAPIAILTGSYILATLILIFEKIYFNFFHLWPYTE